MRAPHPAQIALGSLCVLALIGLWWITTVMLEMQGVSWSGEEPSDEIIAMWAFQNLAYTLLMPALATAGAASALGLVFTWSFSTALRRRSDRREVSDRRDVSDRREVHDRRER